MTADRLKGDSLHINNNKVGIGTQTPEVMLDIDGPIRIGDDATSNAVPGTIRFTGSDFMGFNGNQWVSLTEKSIGSEGSAITVVSGEVISGGDSPVPVYMSKDGVIMAQTEAEMATPIHGINRAAQMFHTDIGTTEINGVWLYHADDTLKLDFIGFAMTSAATGQHIVVQTTGIIDGFNDLVIGEKYYIQDDGSINNSQGTNGKYIGVATSKSQITMKSDTIWLQDQKGISHSAGNVCIGQKNAEAQLQVKIWINHRQLF